MGMGFYHIYVLLSPYPLPDVRRGIATPFTGNPSYSCDFSTMRTKALPTLWRDFFEIAPAYLYQPQPTKAGPKTTISCQLLKARHLGMAVSAELDPDRSPLQCLVIRCWIFEVSLQHQRVCSFGFNTWIRHVMMRGFVASREEISPAWAYVGFVLQVSVGFFWHCRRPSGSGVSSCLEFKPDTSRPASTATPVRLSAMRRVLDVNQLGRMDSE